MAEAIFRQFSEDQIEVFSAGTEPGKVEPEAIDALTSFGVNTEGLHSKAIADLPATEFDYVISLCDRARSECNLTFKSMNFIAWDFPDPVLSRDGSGFKKTAQELSERIRMFLLILRKQKSNAHVFNTPQGFFKVMSDPLRLTMMMMLENYGELCVCDFVDATGMSQPKVSRHLAQLRAFGLLVDRKDQRWVYYKINPALPDWMKKVLATTATYNPQFKKDLNSGCG